MHFNLFGQRSTLGFGIYFSGFADAFLRCDAVGREVREYDQFKEAEILRARQEATEDDINIWFAPSPHMRTVRGRHIVLCIFEATRLPRSYIDFVRHGAEVFWAPSQWAFDVLVANGFGPDEVDVVPGGVNSRLFHPFSREDKHSFLERLWPGRRKQATRFLTIAKFEERKGYRQLLDAFTSQFGERDDVELHIKGDYFMAGDRRIPELERLLAKYNSKKVFLHQGKMSDTELLALYHDADAFVFPSRAEAWGLPLIEAIACGLTVVSTRYSGHAEYLDRIPGNFLEIKHKLVPISDEEMKKTWSPDGGELGVWAEPDTDHLGLQMRAAHENAAEWKARGLQASQVIRTEFDWDQSVVAALEALQARAWID